MTDEEFQPTFEELINSEQKLGKEMNGEFSFLPEPIRPATSRLVKTGPISLKIASATILGT